jgi:hypothetical protein
MSNEHGRPAGEPEEPLYDTNVPTPSHAERARTLVASIGTGTLCTIAREPDGYPYGSFVTFALDGGHPVFLISELAEHTRNLRTDPRASLLVAEIPPGPLSSKGSGDADPLARGRVTLLGECRVVAEGTERESAKQAFLGVHRNAAYYAEYRDFAFWRLSVDSIRYIGGYGRMSWVSREEWFAAAPDPIAPHARMIIDHMNADHADALIAYCQAFTRARDSGAATMTGVDRYGFEMSVQTARGPRPVRLAFSQPVATADEVRREMVALVKRARG